jgi:hypothetical protein
MPWTIKQKKERVGRAETQDKDKKKGNSQCSGKRDSFLLLFLRCQDAQMPSPWHGRRQSIVTFEVLRTFKRKGRNIQVFEGVEPGKEQREDPRG